MAEDRPEGAVDVRYNYPRPLSLVPNIFAERPALRVLQEAQAALIQQYCDGVHWHNLALVGPERRCYYWDPTGKALTSRSAVRLLCSSSSSACDDCSSSSSASSSSSSSFAPAASSNATHCSWPL